jgi:hypothetical protein
MINPDSVRRNLSNAGYCLQSHTVLATTNPNTTLDHNEEDDTKMPAEDTSNFTFRDFIKHACGDLASPYKPTPHAGKTKNTDSGLDTKPKPKPPPQ